MVDQTIKILTEFSETEKLTSLKAKDIMTEYPVTVTESTSIKSTIRILANQKLSSICVVNSSKKIIGVVSEHDLLIQSASQDIGNNINYTANVITANETDNFKEVLLKVLKNKLKIIPIIDAKGTLVGLITRIDLLQTLTEI